MKLSIITINLNNYHGLRKTIDSVITQSWQQFEWIIIDGGSTDGSKELIESTVAGSPCITFWCSEQDNGIYNAMNKGIQHATGDYCLFLNSGDRFAADTALQNALDCNFSDDIVSFDSFLDSGTHCESVCKVSDSRLSVLFFMQATLPHQSTFILRKLFLDYGLYDESLRIVSDWKFFFQTIVFHKASFTYYSFPLTYIQPDGISSANEHDRISERQKVITSLFPPLILQDYSSVKSVDFIRRSSWLCKCMYALLYRFADFHYKTYSVLHRLFD